MATVQHQTGFMDLPLEIRNQIYGEVLRPIDVVDKKFGPQLSIDTTILNISGQVHREAYIVMIKLHRFIRLQFWNNAIRSSTPIAARHRSHAENFDGYMLQVTLTIQNKNEKENMDAFKQLDVIVLGTGMKAVCNQLLYCSTYFPGLPAISVRLTVDPCSMATQDSALRAPIGDTFLQKSIKELLEPVRALRMRSMDTLVIDGQVDPELAKEIMAETSEQSSEDIQVPS